MFSRPPPKLKWIFFSRVHNIIPLINLDFSSPTSSTSDLFKKKLNLTQKNIVIVHLGTSAPKQQMKKKFLFSLIAKKIYLFYECSRNIKFSVHFLHACSIKIIQETSIISKAIDVDIFLMLRYKKNSKRRAGKTRLCSPTIRIWRFTRKISCDAPLTSKHRSIKEIYNKIFWNFFINLCEQK